MRILVRRGENRKDGGCVYEKHDFASKSIIEGWKFNLEGREFSGKREEGVLHSLLP